MQVAGRGTLSREDRRLLQAGISAAQDLRRAVDRTGNLISRLHQNENPTRGDGAALQREVESLKLVRVASRLPEIVSQSLQGSLAP